MIKELPILFQSEMVKAIIEGKKTMTRRIVTKRNSRCTTLLTGDGQSWKDFDFNNVVVDGWLSAYQYLKVAVPSDGTRHRIFCKFNPKDIFIEDFGPTILWVRETWSPTINIPDTKYWYAASVDDMARIMITWKPSIFMPKAAARIWLEVTSVRAERVQEISWDDAVAEGCSGYRPTQDEPTHQYKRLWEKINGVESWATNPWVWVIEFKVLSTTGRPT